MPRVSVVIPAYNCRDSVVEALRSVQAQTYADWEVLVADDHSDDGTADVVEGLDVSGVTVIRRAANGGPAAARNEALRHARGELVAFLDADDLWLPRYLESQVAAYDRAVASGRRAGVVACDAWIGAEGAERYLEAFPWPIHAITLDVVLRRNCVYISALVPREAGDEVGWFTEELFGTEDHDLWLRILETGRVGILNREPLAVYRPPSTSISSNLARMARNNQRTYELALERGRLSPAQRRAAIRERRYSVAMEAVARARWSHGESLGARVAQLVRAAPIAVVVLLTQWRHWPEWLRVIRGSPARLPS